MAANEYWIQEETTTDMKSCVVMQQSCTQWWDMWQQYAYQQLAILIDSKNIKFKTNMSERAFIIAGIYAKFYLEMEKYGNTKLIGRYYWMGLGAFASKTVGFSFAEGRAKINFVADNLGAMHILSAGNFWLFMDVAPWHWSYSQCQESYFKCFEKRNSNQFQNTKLKVAINLLSEYFRVYNKKVLISDDILSKINNFKYFFYDEKTEIEQSYIGMAFKEVSNIEYLIKNNSSKRKIWDAQVRHLLHLANHEQRVVLQNLCWNNPIVIHSMKFMRSMSWLAPDLQLVLTPKKRWFYKKGVSSTDYVSTPKDKEVINEMKKIFKQEEFKVEHIEHRMIWIKHAAYKYHRLMMSKKLDSSLQEMAKWDVNNNPMQ